LVPFEATHYSLLTTHYSLLTTHYTHYSPLTIFKVTRDILEIGDVWAHDLSPLELQNAETKRVYERGGARHLQFASEGTTQRKGSDGIVTCYSTRGYHGSAATSVLTKMLATSYLRVGGGEYTMPSSRRAERVFGSNSAGRSKDMKGDRAEAATPDYDPANDKSLRAFVRLILDRIASA
jgi:hypothetical protein